MKSKNFLKIVIVLIFIILIAAIIVISIFKEDIDTFFLNDADGLKNSALGIGLSIITTIATFILSFFQVIINLENDKINGIKLKDLYRMMYINQYLFLAIMLLTLSDIAVVIVTYTLKEFFVTILLSIVLLILTIIMIFIETFSIFMDDDTMYWIIKNKMRREYNKRPNKEVTLK